MATWKSHARDEDLPGQRVLFSASKDAKSWQPAAVLIDSLSPATEDQGYLMHVHASVVVNDHVYAPAVVRRVVAWTSGKRVKRSPRRGHGLNIPVLESLPRIVRRVHDGAPAGPAFWLATRPREGLAHMPMYPALPPPVPADMRALRAREEATKLGPYPKPAEPARLTEAIFYIQPNGKQVCLFRDNRYSRRLFASVRSSADEKWPPAVKTNIPDSGSLSCVGALPDGRIDLIGNQVEQHPFGELPKRQLHGRG